MKSRRRKKKKENQRLYSQHQKVMDKAEMMNSSIISDSITDHLSDGIEKSSAFDFSKANDDQKEAILSSDGPVLITAGLGTGKTYTLVQRALYLILEKGVKPEQILMATFTEKAAKELVTRLSNELASHNVSVNINEMYIGTFHSICLRIIKEHLEYTRIKKNFLTLDDFDQKYIVFQNIYPFQKITNYSLVIDGRTMWEQAKSICSYANMQR